MKTATLSIIASTIGSYADTATLLQMGAWVVAIASGTLSIYKTYKDLTKNK